MSLTEALTRATNTARESDHVHITIHGGGLSGAAPWYADRDSCVSHRGIEIVVLSPDAGALFD